MYCVLNSESPLREVLLYKFTPSMVYDACVSLLLCPCSAKREDGIIWPAALPSQPDPRSLQGTLYYKWIPETKFNSNGKSQVPLCDAQRRGELLDPFGSPLYLASLAVLPLLPGRSH